MKERSYKPGLKLMSSIQLNCEQYHIHFYLLLFATVTGIQNTPKNDGIQIILRINHK